MRRQILLAIVLGCTAGGAGAEESDSIQLRPRIAPNQSVVGTLPARTRPGVAANEQAAVAPNRLSISIAPYAGFSAHRSGGMPQGGAIVMISHRGSDVADNGSPYLFAAAGRQAVALNMQPGARGGGGPGWRTDQIGAFAGDIQVGLGWRRGEVRSSLGLIYRQIKGEHLIAGQRPRDDALAAFTVSIAPGP